MFLIDILFFEVGSVGTLADSCPPVERGFIVGCVRFVRRGSPYSGYVWH